MPSAITGREMERIRLMEKENVTRGRKRAHYGENTSSQVHKGWKAASSDTWSRKRNHEAIAERSCDLPIAMRKTTRSYQSHQERRSYKKNVEERRFVKGQKVPIHGLRPNGIPQATNFRSAAVSKVQPMYKAVPSPKPRPEECVEVERKWLVR